MPKRPCNEKFVYEIGETGIFYCSKGRDKQSKGCADCDLYHTNIFSALAKKVSELDKRVKQLEGARNGV